MDIDKQLTKLLSSLPEQPLTSRRAKKAELEWDRLSDEEKLELLDKMKAQHRAANRYFGEKETRRKQYVDDVIARQIEAHKNTAYVVPEKFRCRNNGCGHDQFHVAEVVGGELVTLKKRGKPTTRHKLFKWVLTCMKCRSEKVLVYKQPVEFPLEERLAIMSKRTGTKITMTY